MNKIRNAVLIIVAIGFGFLLWAFSQSVGATGLSSLEQPYNITHSANKLTSNEINHRLESFANHHQINIVKEFWVPTPSANTHPSYYVLGKAHHFTANQISKSALASRSEFLTSDLRYPLYVFGPISSQFMRHELTSLGLTFERKSENWHLRISDFLLANDYSIFLALLLLLLFLTLVIHNFKSLRAANIMLLQGLTKRTIFKRAFLRDQAFFLTNYTIVCGTVFGTLFFAQHWGVFWITAYLALLLAIAQTLVYLAAGLIWSWSYRQATILPTIKGRAKSRLTLAIVLVIKTLTELLILFALLSLGQQFLTSQAIKAQVGTWSRLPTRYSPTLAININDQEQAVEDRQTYQLVKWSAQHHGLIANYAGYTAAEDRPTLDFNDYSDYYNGGNVLLVNATYLRLNQVRDSSGHRLTFSANAPVTHILLPAKLAKQQKKLTNAYVDQMNLRHMAANDDAHPRVHTQLLENHQQRLTYNPAGLDLGYYNASVPDPVIIVISPASLGGDNDGADRLWNSMLSNGAFSFSDYRHLNRQLTALGLYQHIGGYTNIKSYASKVYQAQRQQVIRLASILALLVGLFLLECVLACSLYLGIYQQDHAIRTLMGQSLVKVHAAFAVILTGLTLGELALTLVVKPASPVILTYYLAASGLTLLTLAIKARRNVAHLKTSLKGDN